MARPSKYETHVKPKMILVEGWARDGLTDEQIAHNLGVATSTFYEYKKNFKELSEALTKGKEVVDYEVENALLRNALTGDTTAQIFWLKNRRPHVWRDRREVENSGSIEVKQDSFKDFDNDDLKALLKLARADEE